MKPTDTKGALNYTITRTFLYFIYFFIVNLTIYFSVFWNTTSWTFWNANALFLPEVSRMKQTRIYIYTHTKTHIALAHMHHKNTDSRSRRARQQVICCLLCITWTRPAVNPYNIEAPFIFRALYRWQSSPNVTVFTKSLHFNATIFILHIKRHEMCPKKIKSKKFFFSPYKKMFSFIHHTNTILTRCTRRYSCPLSQQGPASYQ